MNPFITVKLTLVQFKLIESELSKVNIIQNKVTELTCKGLRVKMVLDLLLSEAIILGDNFIVFNPTFIKGMTGYKSLGTIVDGIVELEKLDWIKKESPHKNKYYFNPFNYFIGNYNQFRNCIKPELKNINPELYIKVNGYGKSV